MAEEKIKIKHVLSKGLIVIFMIFLLLVLIIQSIGYTMGYFTDTEVSMDNTLRITGSW